MKHFLFVIAVLAFCTEFVSGKWHHRNHHHDHKNELSKLSRKTSIINGASVSGSSGSAKSNSTPSPSSAHKDSKDGLKIPDACKKVVQDLKDKELKEQQERREKQLREEELKAKINENHITTEVVDSATGKPALNLKVSTWKMENNEWAMQTEKLTNVNGKVTNSIAQDKFAAGIYKLQFDSKTYYNNLGLQTLYPYIDIDFEVTNADDNFHIALVIGPYGYSTSRGTL